MTQVLDSEYLRGWIGREEIAHDSVTPDLARKFHATLDLPDAPPELSERAPQLIHFCLCQSAASTLSLGPDGHPARGGFLPPVPLPRRMWAGSTIRFMGDIRVGDAIRRRSTISDVVVKEGRTGTLCFVTVTNEISADDVPVVEDVQTIVYRAIDAAPPPAPTAPSAPLGASTRTVEAGAVLLFRYSALTFNGHRIHYDHPYATGVEGYPGLIVHGPLQATLLLHAAIRERQGALPTHFSFRSVSTLFDKDPVCLHSGPAQNDTMELWTARPDGPVAMRAEARWS